MDAYEVRLDNFTGPLDLLLHLVKEKQMDLMNLEISKITEQYLLYIQANRDLHLEIASEYLVMAANLIEAKSRLLIPKEKVELEDGYEKDPREALIQQLLEYKKYKDVVESLKIQKEERELFHTKIPSNMAFLSDESNLSIPSNLDAYALIKAMQKLMARKIKLAPMKQAVAKKEISIEDCQDQIKRRLSLRMHEKVKLEDLFDEGDKQLFVMTFLAILVLANQKDIAIYQDNQFSDIYVEGLWEN